MSQGKRDHSLEQWTESGVLVKRLTSDKGETISCSYGQKEMDRESSGWQMQSVAGQFSSSCFPVLLFSPPPQEQA